MQRRHVSLGEANFEAVGAIFQDLVVTGSVRAVLGRRVDRASLQAAASCALWGCER